MPSDANALGSAPKWRKRLRDVGRGAVAALPLHGLLLASCYPLSAAAAPISAVFDQTLSATPVTISFDGVTVASLFSANTGYGPGASVSTSGTGMVTTIGGSVVDFYPGSTIDQTHELYTFATDPSAAVIPYSAADDFIGLSVTLTDGVHYGYAEVSGPSLLGVGFESTPGATILTGETGETSAGILLTTGVPEPASITLLAAGVAMLCTRHRRYSRANAPSRKTS